MSKPAWHPDQSLNLTRWQCLCQQVGIAHQPAIEQEFRRIVTAYNETHRAYHTVQHLHECLRLLDWAREQTPTASFNGTALEMALWYHDVVYQPQASDNERFSADQAIAFLRTHQVESAQVNWVESLILATRHGADTGLGVPTELVSWMVDIDLAILAARPQRFWQYNQQIRQEYAWLPENVYRTKRQAVLAQFLARAPIYRFWLFRERFETQARKNLLAALGTSKFSP